MYNTLLKSEYKKYEVCMCGDEDIEKLNPEFLVIMPIKSTEM